PCRPAERAVRPDGQDERLRDSDGIRVAGDSGQPLGCRELRIGGPIAIRAATRLDELNEPQIGDAAQRPKIAGLEGLDEDRRIRARIAEPPQSLEKRRLEGEARCREITRVLRLGIYPDPRNARHAAFTRTCRAFRLELPHEREDLLECRHLELTVAAGIRGPQFRDALACPEPLDLGKREILAEPALDRHAVDQLARASRCEFGVPPYIRRPADLILVASDQYTVAGAHEVGFDVIGALLDRDAVCGERVLRSISARTTVGDHDRPSGRCRAACAPGATIA